MGEIIPSRLVRWFARAFACALVLAACARYSGPADPNFAKARDLYQQLYASEIDEAYGDPQMDTVVLLLENVNKRSVDSPSAQALLHAIDHGREELAKVHVDREKLRKAAAEVVARPSNIDPSRVLEQPEVPLHNNVAESHGMLYRLAPNPVCRDRLPGFVGQAVMVSEGKIYRRILDSQVPHSPPPAAGAPDAGAPTRAATTSRAAAAGAGAGVQEYLVVPGGPLPPAEAATATARAAPADGGY